MSLKSNQLQLVMLQKLSNAFVKIPFNHMLGLKLEHLDAEHVVMTFAMKENLVGNFLHGILHGGVISSVLDMAGGMVVMSSSIQKHSHRNVEELTGILGKSSTVDLQISFVNPGRGDHFTAKAWLIKSGNKLSFTRMELYNNEQELIATGSATYLAG